MKTQSLLKSEAAHVVANQNSVKPAEGKDWQIRIHSDHTILEAAWRRLENEGCCTVFQTYDWAACWYDTSASCDAAEPLIITVSHGNGDIVWIIPLCLYRKKGLRIISFADLGLADYTGPVMSPHAPCDPETIKTILETLLESLPPHDLIHFQKLAGTIDGKPNPLHALGKMEPFPVSCYGIPLKGPWPALREKIMDSKMRANLRRRKKLVKKEGNLTVQYFSTAQKLKPLIGKIIAMRNDRFTEIGREAMPPLWQIFYKNLASRSTRSFQASIATLDVSGQTIATCFGLTRGNRYHAIIPTFEMGKWHRFSPGRLLFDEMMTDFAEEIGGEGYFDFTVGDEPYKGRFGCEEHQLYEYMAPRSLKGSLTYKAWRVKVKIRRYPKLFAALQKFKFQIVQCLKAVQ